MQYLFRFLLYLVIFGFVFSVSLVVVLRFVPVTITPLKVVRLVENFPEQGIKIHSNWISLEKINSSVPRAVVATEDNRFMEHHGFDWEAIEQAREEYRQGGRRRGGSSISQQTAKNVFCYPSSTWFRKGVETYYTVLIELLWGKHRIMETYLNIIETGPNRYGVEATARRVYNKPASKLNAYEASMIATALPNPLRMRIENPSNYMVQRAAQVRSLMNKVPALDL